jgi:hypothetical protein
MSLVPSGYFGSSIDNIVVLENFIDEEDLKAVYEFCLTVDSFQEMPGDPWDNRVLNTEGIETLNKSVSDTILKYQKKLKNVIENRFGFKLDNATPSLVKNIES